MHNNENQLQEQWDMLVDNFIKIWLG